MIGARGLMGAHTIHRRLDVAPRDDGVNQERARYPASDCKCTPFLRILRSMKNELDAQIVSLKAQLAVLEAQIRRHESKADFADLYGLLRGQADSSEKEIDSVRYCLSKDGAD